MKDLLHISFTPDSHQNGAFLHFLRFVGQNAYGCGFCCLRLRIPFRTVTDFHVYGCGCLRNRTDRNFRTVTDFPVTVSVLFLVKNSYFPHFLSLKIVVLNAQSAEWFAV